MIDGTRWRLCLHDPLGCRAAQPAQIFPSFLPSPLLTAPDYRLQQQPGSAPNQDIAQSFEWSYAQAKLDLFQIFAVLATKPCAGPAQVVGAEVFDSNLLCGLFDD
jgi:hypothetical protein